MELEVDLPKMTSLNRNNRVYENELPIGIKAPVTLGIPDTFDTPLVDMVGEVEVIEGNVAKITFFENKEDHATDIIAGDKVLVPRGAGKVDRDNEKGIFVVTGFRLKDFNIIEKHRSAYL